jgi:ABC-type multidrug transport system ATPase subunit
LSVVPQIAFQRGIGAILGISTESDDPDLEWSEVWAFQTRVWYSILVMTIVGIAEWWYLFRLTTAREAKTKLDGENREMSNPISVQHDPLIARERDRSLADDDGINARSLVKVFEVRDGKRKKEKKLKKAVKGISFGVRKNEIFALLGPNGRFGFLADQFECVILVSYSHRTFPSAGAGKTVTMSMLSSQITPEHGQIALDGVVVDDIDRSTDCLYNRANVSYCAQSDALFESLSVDEHCRFYANVRGLDWENDVTQEHVGTIVKLLGLEKHRHKKADDLSGGYKRRLCLAISIIGYPNVCMLDEPTTGLDPGARHQVWEVLKPEGVPVPPILMSSHYMDECAELGTRIGIMIDGEFVSTGSMGELYEKYCTNFFVEVSFNAECDHGTAEQSLLRVFGDASASVYESLPFHIKIQVTINDRKEEASTRQLAKIFALLESKKHELNIKFYSVAKMNLEQIFIDLSRKQFEVNEQLVIAAPQESARNLSSIRSL